MTARHWLPADGLDFTDVHADDPDQTTIYDHITEE